MNSIDIDVGGTFTDLVLNYEGASLIKKVPTTPYDLSVCFSKVIEEGAASVGLLAARFRLDRVLTVCLLITAVMMAVFSSLLANFAIAFVVALLIGFFSNGCIAGLYALTPSLYPLTQRVTGLGWAIGFGRIGAILAPTLTGALIGANWRPGSLFLLFSTFFVLAAVLVALMNARGASV